MLHSDQKFVLSLWKMLVFECNGLVIKEIWYKLLQGIKINVYFAFASDYFVSLNDCQIKY